MRVSRAQMAENRARILAEAGRLFREKGFDAVSIAEVMKAAEMTHGGFYGHFSSKDDLIAQAVTHETCDAETDACGFADYLQYYLSPDHRDSAAGGCATAAMAPALRHQCAEAREAMAGGIEEQIARVSGALARDGVGDGGGPPEALRREAIGRWSAMVGAMIMARAVDDPALSDELLAETRAWIAGRAADDT